MSFILLAVWILGAFCIVKSHTKISHKTVSKKRFWLATILLTCIIAWGGAKPDIPDEPDEPEPPDPPEPPIVENIRIKLIGKVNEDGKFVPLTSQWQDITVTNGVIDATTIEGIDNNE